MNETEQQLARIWAQVPSVECKGLCTEACGPIAMSTAEFKNLRAYVGERIQGVSLYSGVAVTNFQRHTMACPLLKDGKCSAYDQRPLVCRLFGAVKEMRCPFGCKPKQWVTDEKATALLEEASKLT